MAYLALFIGLLGAAILLVYAAGSMPAARLAKILRYAGGGVLSLVTAFLAVTGRIGLAIPVGLAAMALFRGDLGALGGFARSLPGMGSKSAGQTSDVETPWLVMWLDHDSGEMGGRVRQGRFAGAELESLSDDDLITLREELAPDEDSLRVLDTYLDRMRAGEPRHDSAGGGRGGARGSDAGGRAHSGWGSGSQDGTGDGARDGARRSSSMSREDAYEVLGLKPGAGEEDIRAAHRELMQRVHPDKGGSSFLAAQLNQAKDTLLGQ